MGQYQTEYQKKLDITPVSGCATVVELHEMEVKVMDFGDWVEGRYEREYQ